MKMVIERMKNGDRCWDFLLLPHGFGGFERVKMFFIFRLSVSLGFAPPYGVGVLGFLLSQLGPG